MQNLLVCACAVHYTYGTFNRRLSYAHPNIYIYMERYPAKSPLGYFIFQDKQKKSNARIEMYAWLIIKLNITKVVQKDVV